MATLRSLLRELRSDFPLDLPVVVRRTPLVGLFGKASLSWKKTGEMFYRIDVSSKLSPELLTETLIHEWAHCLVWDVHDEDDHGPSWGQAYSEIYQSVMAT